MDEELATRTEPSPVSQTFRDEFGICTLIVGTTKERELNSQLGVYVKNKRQGLVVEDGPDARLHYYTTKSRKAVICVGCRHGLVEHIRLKMGFWGPLTQLKEIPAEALSDCYLDHLGTTANVHLAGAREWHTRDRVLEKYGPPASESTQGTTTTMGYRWPAGSIPRALTFTLKNNRIVEIFLERLPASAVSGIRPLAPATAFQRKLPLPAHLQQQLEDGEALLGERRSQQAEQIFDKVFSILEEDDPIDPSFIKAHVMSRRALARAQSGRADCLEEALRCRNYLLQWDGRDGHYTLAVSLTVAQIQGLLGQPKPALKALNALWDTLQDSKNYYDPHLQYLVRQTAAELAILGSPEYLQAIQEQDPT